VALYFYQLFSKTYHMPNSANSNNKKSKTSHGKGHAEEIDSNASAQKPNAERSDIKHGTDEPQSHHGDTSRSSNQGRKEASGGTLED
jgi:hypothetical protein